MGRPAKIKAEHIRSTQAETARAAGVSRQAVHFNRKVKKIGATVDIEESKRGLESIEEAQARKERALADLREMEFAEKSGLLINADEAAQVLSTATQAVRDGVLSIPDRIAPQLAAMADPREVRALLAKELRKALSAISENIRVPTSEAA